VVVIDDNRDAADAAAMFVEDLGNEVRVAYDGETGVDLARSFRPGSGAARPRDGGRRRLRDVPPDPGRARFGVFLVALTGWGQDHDKRATALAGFDAAPHETGRSGRARPLISGSPVDAPPAACNWAATDRAAPWLASHGPTARLGLETKPWP
jgi:CheY-like chemotaxis protein